MAVSYKYQKILFQLAINKISKGPCCQSKYCASVKEQMTHNIMQFRNKKINFRKLLERQLNRAPVDRTARRNYLIALNSLMQQDLTNSLRVQMSRNSNPKTVPQQTQYNRSFMSKSHHRPTTVSSSDNIDMRNKTACNFAQNTQAHRPHAMSLYQRIELRERELKIYKKRSEEYLSNPFYKIQHTRTKTSEHKPPKNQSIKTEPPSIPIEPPKEATPVRPRSRLLTRPPTRHLAPIILTEPNQKKTERSIEKGDNDMPVRERSETVKYQEIKVYFENKYCSK